MALRRDARLLLLLAVTAGGGADERTGTASLSGSAAFGAVVGTADRTGTGALSGTAAFGTPTASRQSTGTASALTGTGAFGAPTGTRNSTGTASLSGSGTYGSPTGARASTGTAALTGTGTLGTPTATRNATGTASLAGTGAYGTPTATRESTGTGALSGAAALGTPTASRESTGTAALTGSAAFGALTATRDSTGTGSLSGSGSLGPASGFATLDGGEARSGTATPLTGAGTLGTATGIPDRTGTAALSGTGTLGASTGTPDRAGTATLSGSAAFGTPTASRESSGTAALTGAGVLGTATGTREEEGEPTPPVLGDALTIHLVDMRHQAQLVDARHVAHLTDIRQHQVHLLDRRSTARLVDLRQYTVHLAVVGNQEVGVSAVYVVSGRVPTLTAAGTPPPPLPTSQPTRWLFIGATVEGGALVASPRPIIAAEPYWYAPGPLRPGDPGVTRDTFRVTNDAGVIVDVVVQFHSSLGPAAQSLEVEIGTDGVAALTSGGALALTATGGTGPYVWEMVTNRSGATITPEGAYVAGPSVGIDRVQVTDALGEIGLAQLEVRPGALGFDLAGLTPGTPIPYSVTGFECIPYARLLCPAGSTFTMLDAQTGAVIVPPHGEHAEFHLTMNLDGSAVDLTGWTFDAKLYSQRGGVMADGLAVVAAGNAVTVDLPDPSTVPLDIAVLRVTATTAGAIAALGYPTTSFEMLLIAPEA